MHATPPAYSFSFNINGQKRAAKVKALYSRSLAWLLLEMSFEFIPFKLKFFKSYVGKNV